MNWYKRAQIGKKLLKNLEKKKQVSLQKGWTPEEINWAENLSIKLGTPSYFLWLLNQTRNGSVNIETREDDRKVFEALHKFEELKQKKLITEDILQYPTFSDLFRLMSKFQTERSKETEKEISSIKGAELLYSKDNITVIKVTNFKAGEILFEDSGWCVKYLDEFKNYGSPFLLFRIHNKNYALYHQRTGGFKDRNDRTMSFSSTTKILDSIKYLIENNLIQPLGESKIMLKVIQEEEEINKLCQNNDLVKLKETLEKNLSYATLINKFYLSPEVVQIIENIFKKVYNNLNTFKGINDFYNDLPDYLSINNFLLTEEMSKIICDKIEKGHIQYEDLPKTLRNNPKILQALKLEWIKKLKQYPSHYRYSYFPKVLKNDPEILQALKFGWIEELKQHPRHYRYSYFPQDLRNDPEILQVLKLVCIEWLKKDPLYYDNPAFPQDLRNDPEILQARKLAWIEQLKKDPLCYEETYAPKDLRNDPEILQARKLGWIKKLKQHPLYYDQSYVPKDLKNDPEILQARKLGWIEELKKDPIYYDQSYFPKDLKNDPEILRIVGKNR
jgi:hypothetical protein